MNLAQQAEGHQVEKKTYKTNKYRTHKAFAHAYQYAVENKETFMGTLEAVGEKDAEDAIELIAAELVGPSQIGTTGEERAKAINEKREMLKNKARQIHALLTGKDVAQAY
jgi:hypothetical protein